ncbi:MAG: hypothetical protein NTV49_04185 [Kiritimatiellaeota bacterium]|nr:hypothetical protein [Kiritimatiellota bacterium]
MRAHVIMLLLVAALAAPAAETPTQPPPAAAEAPRTREALAPVLAPLSAETAATALARPIRRTPHPDDISLTLMVQQFTWQEFDADGERLLKESGPLFGFDVGYRQVGRRYGSSLGVGVFGGRVDYDGHTQAGVPATTHTVYTGLEGRGDLLARFEPARHLTLEAFLGLGGRLWDRSLQDQGQLKGYSELWASFFGRVGFGATYAFARDGKAFAQAGGRLPLTTIQNVDLTKFGAGNIKLQPRQQITPFVEAGCRWKLLQVSIFYETLRFDKSAAETITIIEGSRIGTLEFWQPKSTADIYGLRIGLAGNF